MNVQTINVYLSTCSKERLVGIIAYRKQNIYFEYVISPKINTQ